MRLLITGLVAALAAMASAYTDPDYSQDPSGNAVLKPGLGERVPAGKPYKITWEPTTKGPVSLVLLRGPSTNVQPIDTIADSIANSGSYEWSVPDTLKPDTTHYGILLVVEGTGQYQYSTQFGISNPNYEESGETSPVGTPAPTETTTSTKTVTSTSTSTHEESSTPMPTSTETTTTTTTTTTTKHTATPTVTTITTTEAPVETTSTDQSPSTATEVVQTTLQSSPVTSTQPTPSQPVHTGAASRSSLNMGALALGMAAVLAF